MTIKYNRFSILQIVQHSKPMSTLSFRLVNVWHSRPLQCVNTVRTRNIFNLTGQNFNSALKHGRSSCGLNAKKTKVSRLLNNYFGGNLLPLSQRGQRHYATSFEEATKTVTVCGRELVTDHMTNVNPRILSHIGRSLHMQKGHPLRHTKERLLQCLHNRYHNRRGNPVFSIIEDLPPLVTVRQNFDQLLVPPDHVCRQKGDNYYVNSEHLLRAHTSAHQSELLESGLDNFVVVGDVYRRDQVDALHYPVFHQMEGVKLYSAEELLPEEPGTGVSGPQILTGAPSTEACSPDTVEHQAAHTPQAVAALTADLQACLQSMATSLFGQGTQCRWVPAYFPFTQPSWELEVLLDDSWVELLGCGIVQQRILETAGVRGKVGWAFGLGLERWAMKLYGIPDIRLFWSKDSGFLSQFNFDDPNTPIKYKKVSVFPQCTNDISFWLPADAAFDSNDFYDLVRQIGGDIVEQVCLVDDFTHPKTGRCSHCYRIVYRHMEKTLTQEEVNVVHKGIEQAAAQTLSVTIR